MTNEPATTQDGDLSQFESEKLALAKEKLALAEEKLALADEKFTLAEKKWTPISILVSALAAALAYYSTQTQQIATAESALKLQDRNAKGAQALQRQAANDAFRIKVVEIAMSGTSHEAEGKLKVLGKLFPKEFKKIGTFVADDLNWGRASKYKVLDLIAAHEDPKQRRVIIETYDALFDATTSEKGWFTEQLKDTVVSGKAAQ